MAKDYKEIYKQSYMTPLEWWTLALVAVSAYYAYQTHKILKENEKSRGIVFIEKRFENLYFPLRYTPIFDMEGVPFDGSNFPEKYYNFFLEIKKFSYLASHTLSEKLSEIFELYNIISTTSNSSQYYKTKWEEFKKKGKEAQKIIEDEYPILKEKHDKLIGEEYLNISKSYNSEAS
jgi:hypothetical protein